MQAFSFVVVNSQTAPKNGLVIVTKQFLIKEGRARLFYLGLKDFEIRSLLNFPAVVFKFGQQLNITYI
jgi:hypothetical protein